MTTTKWTSKGMHVFQESKLIASTNASGDAHYTIEDRERQAERISRLPEMEAALKGVLHHNSALKDDLKLSPSLIAQIERALNT